MEYDFSGPPRGARGGAGKGNAFSGDLLGSSHGAGNPLLARLGKGYAGALHVERRKRARAVQIQTRVDFARDAFLFTDLRPQRRHLGLRLLLLAVLATARVEHRHEAHHEAVQEVVDVALPARAEGANGASPPLQRISTGSSKSLWPKAARTRYGEDLGCSFGVSITVEEMCADGQSNPLFRCVQTETAPAAAPASHADDVEMA